MKNISSDTKNPADQQGIIYAFAKIMDPNSVVREGEYATVQKYAQSWANQFGFSVDRIFSNSPFLTKEAINNMKATVDSIVKASEQSYKNVYDEYGRRINKITGGNDGTEFITDYSKGYDHNIGQNIIQSESQAQNDFQTLVSSNPELHQEIANRYNDLKEVLGRNPTASEYFEANPWDKPKQSFNQVVGDTNPAKGVVGGVNLKGYAEDPNQIKSVETIFNKVPTSGDTLDYDRFIKSISPKSPITGNQIISAANTYNLDPRILVALMQHESLMGTSTVARANNNYGGITWSPGYAKAHPETTKGTPRPANEGGYYVKFPSILAGLKAQAELLSKRKIA